MELESLHVPSFLLFAHTGLCAGNWIYRERRWHQTTADVYIYICMCVCVCVYCIQYKHVFVLTDTNHFLFAPLSPTPRPFPSFLPPSLTASTRRSDKQRSPHRPFSCFCLARSASRFVDRLLLLCFTASASL